MQYNENAKYYVFTEKNQQEIQNLKRKVLKLFIV